MSKSTRSLLWAVLIASICVTGLIVFRHQFGERPWFLVAIPIWLPLWVGIFLLGGWYGGLHGVDGTYLLPVVFVLAVLMWWGLIEGGRRLWRRLRGPHGTDRLIP